MSVQIFKKHQQASGEFNGGEIVENKPIGFPQDGGELKPYSNLFYWANASANQESTIGLHPHRGFEIMSFVLQGKLEHYDTGSEKWSPLQAGDVQIIRAGRGISHAEKLHEGAQMFQIWLDPGLQKTLQQDASYNDYRKDEFSWKKKDHYMEKTFRKNDQGIEMDSEGVVIRQMKFIESSFSLKINREYFFSFYLINGKISLNGKDMDADDFALVRSEKAVKIDAHRESELFMIGNPERLGYETYYQLSGY